MSLKLVFDLFTDTKNTTWPLDHFLTTVLAVTTVVYGMTTPCSVAGRLQLMRVYEPNTVNDTFSFSSTLNSNDPEFRR